MILHNIYVPVISNFLREKGSINKILEPKFCEYVFVWYKRTKKYLWNKNIFRIDDMLLSSEWLTIKLLIEIFQLWIINSLFLYIHKLQNWHIIILFLCCRIIIYLKHVSTCYIFYLELLLNYFSIYNSSLVSKERTTFFFFSFFNFYMIRIGSGKHIVYTSKYAGFYGGCKWVNIVLLLYLSYKFS